MNAILSIVLMLIQLLFLLGMMIGLGCFFGKAPANPNSGRDNASNDGAVNRIAAFGAFALFLLLFISFCSVGLRLCFELIGYVFAFITGHPVFAFAMFLAYYGWRVVQRRRTQRLLDETRRRPQLDAEE